jgi:hypothetical protein
MEHIQQHILKYFPPRWSFGSPYRELSDFAPAFIIAKIIVSKNFRVRDCMNSFEIGCGLTKAGG